MFFVRHEAGGVCQVAGCEQRGARMEVFRWAVRMTLWRGYPGCGIGVQSIGDRVGCQRAARVVAKYLSHIGRMPAGLDPVLPNGRRNNVVQLQRNYGRPTARRDPQNVGPVLVPPEMI